MATRTGVCKNYITCDSADKETVFEVGDGADFVCPDCGLELKDADSSKSGEKEFKAPGKKRPWIGYTMLGGVAALTAWGIWAFIGWMQGEPRIALSATSLVFDFQQVGKGEGSQEIEVKNTGKSGTLDISEIRSSDPGFTTRKRSYAIEHGKSARLEILFTPTTAGSHAATLTVVSDDQTQPEAVIKVAGTAGKTGPWWLWDQWAQASQVFEK